ncbi:MAG: PAS domain-containing protein, partial [Leptospiraceae bacterium]|nr:PAS domain-containing protein [Leptospiraceae bacterium]
ETFEEYELTFHNKIETINTDNAKIKELEDELSAAKEYMQSFIEELESSNEELQSLNEEFQSTNEELQSANEELETTNEELQSTNEEMQIAYSELKAANNALEQKEVQFLSTQNKLQTLLNNTLQAFLLIGLDYKILIYNQAAKQLFYRISARSIDTADLIINYIPPENVKDFYNNFNRVKAGETLNGYVSFQNEENEIFWYQYNLSPIKNDAEKIEMISYSLLDISNSKKNEFELEELRELLNLIYENTDTGIAIINSSNILTNVNTGFCKLFAYNRKDILGKNISSILSFFASIDKPDTQNLTSIESKAIKKDGTPFEITIKINQYRRNDGEIFKIIYITDISENKKYKNLLLDTQEAVNVGGWELDLITNHISWTKEVYKIHELEDSFELNKYNFYNFFEPESLHKLMRALSRAIDTGEPFTLELKFITAKKNKRWVRITGKPIQENKKTIKIFFTIQDISEELTVKDEINKLSLVASKTSNAVIITNKKREIQWVNGGFEKLTGYSYEEVKGENPRFLQGHETDPNAIKNIRDNLSLGRTFSEELLNYKKDGSIYWVKIDFTPIHNTLGELTHYIAIERDITREKEDAEKIRSALHEREILLSEIHHRVKNNMAIISGLIELQASYCKDNLLKRTFQESINRIKSIALVHESLYKSGNWAKIQFKEYIEELINNLKRSCNGNKVSIHISSEAMVLDMRYAIPCGLIINELITNSLQHAFRDKDEGNILVSFRNIENTFELRVKDNGSGYNQKEVDRKTSTLGIVLIESLVQQLDGEYKVNSSSGTDSCIYFKIEDEL